MKIIIAGAGDVGYHLAELLSYESQDIVLIDLNQEVLDYASRKLDVLAINGDCTSIEILDKAEVRTANLVLAVTTSENTNLITAILAKKMGAKKTIARVTNNEYLQKNTKKAFSELGIDALISPVRLAAMEILKLIQETYFTDVYDFEQGKMSMIGLTLEACSPIKNKKLSDLYKGEMETKLRPIAILRDQETILPDHKTILKENDHVYFLTNDRKKLPVNKYVGKERATIKNIMILGGSELAYNTASLMEKTFNITLIEKNRERCKFLADKLTETLVIHGDFTNLDLLEEEGIDSMDALISLTPNSETNIISCLSAKKFGVHKTIAQVENTDYLHISQNIGIDTLINKKLIAANNIFRYIRKGKIEDLTSLKGVDAELIEFVLHRDNQITKKSISELPLPKSAVVAGIIRANKGYIPDGDFVMQKEDKVIVFALPEAIPKIEDLFR